MNIFNDRFSALADQYDVVLSDVWGVTHNGIEAFADACDALSRFRAKGGTVILITNAPRPHDAVARQLADLAVSRDVYDGIVTSGDITRGVIAGRPDQSVLHVGPERDHATFAGLDVRFASVEEADYVVCSGLFDDETETADDYRDMLAIMRRRNLFMVCSNPDVVVERGTQLLYCAGAIADLYKSLGGDVLYAGKPHGTIYDQCLAMAQGVRGKETPLSRIIAIGDSVRTDIGGAAAYGIDSVFVTSGIHSADFGERDDPDPVAVDRLFAGGRPKAIMTALRW